MREKRELTFTIEDLKYVFHNSLASTGSARDMSITFFGADGNTVDVAEVQFFYTGDVNYSEAMNASSPYAVIR